MATRKTIDTITDSAVRASAHGLQDVADRMQTGKTAEQKSLEYALSKSTDAEVRAFLESKIAELAKSDVPEIAEIEQAIHNLGYSPLDVLRAGVKKEKEKAEGEKREALSDLADSMVTGKTAEQKSLESAIEATTDESVKAFLRDKLDEIEANTGISVEDAIDTLEDLGYNPIDVFRSGILKKVANLVTWNRRQEDK